MERLGSPKAWLAIVAGAILALGPELFLGFALAFSPGWANCWPLGLTVHTVWAAGMSVVFFLLLMTAAVGSGAVFGAVCCDFGVSRRRVLVAYIAWLACSLVLALLLCCWGFSGVYASALEMWPGGYHPGGVNPC